MNSNKYIHQSLAIIAGFIIALIVILNLYSYASTRQQISSGDIQVVAAENFWGSLVSQLGGSRIHVFNVVSDPNADPHEYESSTTIARQFASAKYIILNGAGYDSWGNKLIGASSSNSNRKVLIVSDLLGKKNGDNPHFWYNPEDVNQVITQIESDLINIDPAGQGYYTEQYNILTSSLATYQNRINAIKQQFNGTKIAATEDVFSYLANATGLDLISPSAFTQAVAEGNDPPTNSVVQFEKQLQNKQAKVLVYNQQTVTPLTDNMKKLALAQNIPIVGITETIQPPGSKFQDWMNSELTNLENALNFQKSG